MRCGGVFENNLIKTDKFGHNFAIAHHYFSPLATLVIFQFLKPHALWRFQPGPGIVHLKSYSRREAISVKMS